MNYVLLLAALCVGAYAQFSPAGQAQIVKAHNTLRSKIAKGTYVVNGTRKPHAKDMRKMVWDDDVAASAQAFVDTCPTGHSDAPNRGIGENLYWHWSNGESTSFDQFGTSASAAWASEFQSHGWKSNYFDIPLFVTGIGHATQMAWANTNLIGCGVKSCKETDGTYKVVVACQYKVQGNILTENIYTAGKTCSACPSGTSCEKSTGLCA